MQPKAEIFCFLTKNKEPEKEQLVR